MAGDKRIETMIAQEDHREAEIILSMIQRLDGENLKSFYSFARGMKYGMKLEKNRTAARYKKRQKNDMPENIND